MKKKLNIIIVIMAVLTTITGCKKFVDVDPPKTELVTSQAFLKDNTATSAVLGIYTNMQNDYSFINSGITVNSALAADELEAFYQAPDDIQFQYNQLLPTNGTISGMWADAYKNMAQINTCIAGLTASTTLTASVKTQLLGETKFCRAFINFYLVNLFGNIPNVTNVDYSQNAALTQSKPTDIYKLIIADLKDAQSLLLATYPTSDKVRPNKWAATALLARVYLYTNDYTNAETQATAVIASGTYPLPSLSDVFLKGSNEAIWQILPISNYSATQEGYTFLADVPYGTPDYTLTDNLVNSFETGDNRKNVWVGNTSSSGSTYYYPNKYMDAGQYLPATINEYYIMLRAGEQYLIRAEARAQAGNITNALADLNVIRNRAGLGNFITTDKATLLTAIANENRHEFFAEWGHRWLDLKRLGTVNAVISAQKSTWKSTASLFPIPQNEINLDKNLIQNPGY